MKAFETVCLSMILATALSMDAAETITFTVKGGEKDRSNALIRVPVKTGGAKTAEITGASGNKYTGQVTAACLKACGTQSGKELVFILPELKAGAKLELKAELSGKAAGDIFNWKEEGDKHIDLKCGDRPVLRYICEPFNKSTPADRERTYKVYHHVYSPDGKQIITKGHGGRYTHHRGIYYGFSRTKYGGTSVDTWHCKDPAHLSHSKVLSSEEGPLLGRHTVEVLWHGKENKVILTEQRELTAINLCGGTLIEFRSILSTKLDKVQLDGDPQHAGFQFRASNEVAEKTKKETYYIRTDGKGKPGETRNWPGAKTQKDLPWNAQCIVLGGQKFTTCYLDHPQNPKPAMYSERDYGRFGSYFVTEVTPDKPLFVTYRIFVKQGELEQADVEALSTDFEEGAK